MKKLLSLALALALVLSMSVTAFAESNGPTVTNGTQNVTGKYVAAAESDPVYKVDISWGSMAFTYTAASKGTWSTSSHTYEGAKPAAWSWADGANAIQVQNHSNAGITVTPKWNADDAYTAVSMNFDKNPLNLLTADNGSEESPATPTVGSITVIPSGDLPKDTNGKIGSITLSIAGTDDSSTGGDPTNEKATITGIEVKVGNTTYKSGETVTLNKNSGNVTIIAKGTNLQNGNRDNWVNYTSGISIPLTDNGSWNITENGTVATRVFELSKFESCITAFEIIYTNDNFGTTIGTGVSILYERSPEEIATINGVSITIDGQAYSSSNTSQANPAKIKKNSTVSITVTGENLAALIDSVHCLKYSPSSAWPVCVAGGWTVDTAANTATQTFSGSEFESNSSAFDLQYTNDTENYTNSGVWIIYEAE